MRATNAQQSIMSAIRNSTANIQNILLDGVKKPLESGFLIYKFSRLTKIMVIRVRTLHNSVSLR